MTVTQCSFTNVNNSEKINISKSTVKSDVLIDLLTICLGEGIDTKSITNSRFVVGKNADHNWNLYKESGQTDTIFHLDKFSSPYVIVNVSLGDLTKEQIYAAALLCKSKSKYKTMNNVGILYTSISNTSLGPKTGSFIINSNRKKNVVFV